VDRKESCKNNLYNLMAAGTANQALAGTLSVQFIFARLLIDGYDDRSWVENGLFRNSKQFWQLTRWFPQKTAAGVHSHLTFVAMLLTVATAFRLWDKAQAGARGRASRPPDRSGAP